LPKPIIFSLIESRAHPKLSGLYGELGYDEIKLTSVRKVVSALKKQKPDVIVAEFNYAYGTNYASCHICNLDTLFVTLQKYSDYQPKFLLFVSKKEAAHVEKLNIYQEIDPDWVMLQPAKPDLVKTLLSNLKNAT
jgi:hypothetical protein